MQEARAHDYRIVDVFTEKPLEGNALAVFPDASGIDEQTMQKIAKELNLAETAFVVPATRSDCVWRVRIFTPAREMAFAGHPTIGTRFVLMDQDLVSRASEQFLLEEMVGPVPVRVDKGPRPLIWLRTPPISDGITFGRGLCARVLGLESGDLLEIAPQLMSAGNPTLFIALKDKATVDRASFDSHGASLLKREGQPGAMCVFVFAATAEGAYSRMFAPEYGIPEDPATGSSTGPLALFMMRHGLIDEDGDTRFVSEQGTKMGRRSILHVHVLGRRGEQGIDIGGHVTPVARGSFIL